MPKFSRVAGATNQSVNILIQNSASTTGAGLTGFATAGGSLLSGMIFYYSFSGTNAASVSQTLSVPATVAASFSAGQIVEIDATHQAGLARLDIPNAMIAASKGNTVTGYISGGTNVAPCVFEIELTGWDNQDAVHGGMSALPNTACTSNASLITEGTGTAQLTTSSGAVLLQATQTGVTIPTVTTVTNQLTAAAIATGVWQDSTSGDFTTASSIGKALYVSNVVPGAAGGHFIAGTNAATTITTGLTTTFTGNLTGSVASVTGAVGSVTAQVSANVTDINSVSTSGVTTVAAVQGTTVAPLFDSNTCIKADLVDIAGSAVSTSTAQLGVNLVNISGSAVSTTSAQLGVNVVDINAQTASAAGTVTFPGTIASPTNITAGTITTVTNLTNAPTSGDLTSTMKTSVTTAANAATTVGITSNRKKGATATFEFLMQNSTTQAPQTGLTVASTISKDGGSSASTANAVTEIGLGQYQIVLTSTEMTADNLFLQFTAASAITYNLSLQTQP